MQRLAVFQRPTAAAALVARYVAAVVLAIGVGATSRARAAEAGWRTYEVAARGPAEPAIAVALYYPTAARERSLVLGPFVQQVAPQAAPEPGFKGLLLLSHGTGGSELGHGQLARALARAGYLVAALRHPGDNWQDSSLIARGASAYFTQRPLQVTRVIDALMADAAWGGRVASDAKGPRIGAFGHSAGGYTVLALAGAPPDTQRLARHCEQRQSEDPIFCSIGRSEREGRGNSSSADAVPRAAPQAAPETATTSLRDARVRAVAALSPVGAVFSAPGLAGVRIPVQLHVAQADRFVVPRLHGEWVAAHLPGASLHRVAQAWHFAFMDTPGQPIMTPDGDIAADPPGFDRAAYLQQLGQELVRFFDGALR